MASDNICQPGSDSQFGPRIDIDCRPFDFTLVFEDAVFHVLPSAVFLLLIPYRLYSLGRTPVKLATYRLALWKLVSELSIWIIGGPSHLHIASRS